MTFDSLCFQALAWTTDGELNPLDKLVLLKNLIRQATPNEQIELIQMVERLALLQPETVPTLTLHDPRGSEAVGLGGLGLANGLGRLDPRPVLHLGEKTMAGVIHHSLRRNGPSPLQLGLDGRPAELGDQAVVRG